MAARIGSKSNDSQNYTGGTTDDSSSAPWPCTLHSRITIWKVSAIKKGRLTIPPYVRSRELCGLQARPR
jgi:hypothetical protein